MRQIVVLKFGGSVLRDRAAIGPVIQEITHWHDRGFRVVVVVSAFAGVTDDLLRQAGEICDHPPHERTAMLLATGELATAALVSLALHQAGVPSAALSPHEVGLGVAGDALDAEPQTANVDHLLKVLETTPVVVVPGFIGVGSNGELRTLGRGGSDLSAICLADACRAVRCRLIKDVAGLYERDPKSDAGESPPKRFEEITYEGALALDADVVQSKAVRYARSRRLQFEVAGFHADPATRVGANQTVTITRT